MFINTRFQTKIIISFSVLMISVILIFALFMRFYFFNNIEDRIIDNTKQLSLKVSQQIDSYIQEIDQISKNFVVNKGIQNTLYEINNNSNQFDQYLRIVYSRKFDDVMNEIIPVTSIPLSHIYIYSKDYKYTYSYNSLTNNFDLIKNNSNYTDKLHDRELIIFSNNKNSKYYNGNDSFSLIRPVIDISTKMYGYVEVQQDYKELNSICDIGNAGEVFILDKEGNFVFPSNTIDESSKLFLLNSKLNSSSGILKDKSDNIYSFNKSLYTGFTVFAKYSNKTVLAPLYLIQNVTLIIILTITLFSLYMIYLISRILVSPVKKLRDKIVRIGLNNMTININEKVYNDEINLLNIAFQDMLDRIKKSVERELAANQEEAKARFAALQAQISPHFIHNVLYVISIFSQENRSNDVVRMCKQLSNMLRYVVNSPFTTVTLEDEIGYTLNYLSLQEKNYEDFLTHEIDMPEQLKGITLPRLVIQPFVENSIHHGFESCKPPWKIIIRCTVDEGMWSILIEDNGCGISNDKLEEINNKISGINTDEILIKNKDEFGMGNIGIINTVMRLKLMYKDSLNFSIFNNKYGGTTVSIQGSIESSAENATN